MNKNMLARRTTLLTALSMLAFAANSLLCKAALLHTDIDAASFTAIRVGAGALVLCGVVATRRERIAEAGSWLSAAALVVYAAGFSFAYVTLPAASGTLILFGAVQTTMIVYGASSGERLQGWRLVGFLLAFSGMVALLLPGLQAPPLAGALLMVAAGMGWGIYSLRAKGMEKPLNISAGNFLRAVPFVAALMLVVTPATPPSAAGVAYALISGGLTSGCGYAIWYMALRDLSATSAATIQLSVPLLATAGAVLFLGESVTLRLVACSVAVLGGIALVTLCHHSVRAEQ